MDKVSGGDPFPHIDTQKGYEQSMRSAKTYDQIVACWQEIMNRLDSEEQTMKYSEIIPLLRMLYSCFSRPPYECDSAAKEIFDDEKIQSELKDLQISEQFILNTVRIGALKGLLFRIESNPHTPVSLPYDGTIVRGIHTEVEDEELSEPQDEIKRLKSIIFRISEQPNLDGYSWANAKLDALKEQERMASMTTNAEAEKRRAEEKIQALERIKKNMHSENFHPDSADADLLRGDFKSKLRYWKAYLESSSGRKVDTLLLEHGNEQITPDLFERLFKENDELFPEKDRMPSLELLDPNSGWFSVLIINKKTTFGEFRKAVYSNMDGWFQLKSAKERKMDQSLAMKRAGWYDCV